VECGGLLHNVDGRQMKGIEVEIFTKVGSN